MRVLVAEFSHESNTFNRCPTDYAVFASRGILRGEAALEARGSANTVLAGMLEVARAQSWEVVPVLSASAPPGGAVTREAFERIAGEILGAARAHRGRLDGVFLGLHGAMVIEDCEDGEGELLARMRDSLGPDLPIAVTLDPHGNITRQMIENAQILLSYKTYPHVDMRDIGRQAAQILQRQMRGEIRALTLRVDRPMIEEVNAGRTDIGPMVARIDAARAYETQADVFAVSVNCGFGNADIREVGPTVLVTYQGDPTPHLAFAESLAEDIWACRFAPITTFLSVDEAAAEARAHPPGIGPLILADYADNPGAGGYGDATALLAALIEAVPATGEAAEACFGPIVDPEAAAELQQYPLGVEITLPIGGKGDPRLGGGPLTVTGRLIHRGAGAYRGDGPIIGGLDGSWGVMAVLRVAGVDVLITTARNQIYDLQQFRAFGIDPAGCRIIGLKSMQHFRAAFAPIAARILLCDSGALCTPDFSVLPYERVRRPIFPLDR